MNEGLVLLLVGIVMSASCLVALGAARTGLPVLVAFLALGMILGSDGPGGINFDNAVLTRDGGIVALALILYEGGLKTSWRQLRPVAVPAALLSTVGVIISAMLTGLAAHLLLQLPWLEAILLGSVASSTDSAAVFSTLHSTHIRVHLARTLEAESGGNDPIAISLTLGLIAWIQRPHGYGVPDLVLLMFRQIGLGLVIGLAIGAVATWMFLRFPHSISAFAPVASLAVVAISFGAADAIGGSGFLAVYLAGLAVGSTPTRYRRELVAFHEGLAFLSQVALFVVLGLLVYPHQLLHIAGDGLAITLLLVLIIRPVSVWISTALSKFDAQERLLLGWAGLRGAAPIVLATFAISSHVPGANTIFNVVFFVVVISAILQGTTLKSMARRLDLLIPASGRDEIPLEVSAKSKLELLEFAVSAEDSIAGTVVKDLGLPRSALVAVVSRGDESIPPRGSTVLEANDRLFVLAPKSMRGEIEDMFSIWRSPM